MKRREGRSGGGGGGMGRRDFGRSANRRGGEKKKGRRKIHRPHVLRFYESKEIGLGSGREPL